MSDAQMLGIFVLLAIVAGGIFALTRFRHRSRMQEIRERRRASSRMVAGGTLVDGNRHIPVELALSKDALIWENEETRGEIDLQYVTEVEYENELATGQELGGKGIMRLRTRTQAFEFILDEGTASEWTRVLPARHGEGARAVAS